MHPGRARWSDRTAPPTCRSGHHRALASMIVNEAEIQRQALLRPGDRIVLTGDSVTDWGRDRGDPDSLGHGYAGIVAAVTAPVGDGVSGEHDAVARAQQGLALDLGLVHDHRC